MIIEVNKQFINLDKVELISKLYVPNGNKMFFEIYLISKTAIRISASKPFYKDVLETQTEDDYLKTQPFLDKLKEIEELRYTIAKYVNQPLSSNIIQKFNID